MHYFELHLRAYTLLDCKTCVHCQSYASMLTGPEAASSGS